MLKRVRFLLTLAAMLGASAVASQADTTPGTIVAVAAADGRFTTLVAAVKAAGLAETLGSPGPYTVFAPTDDAFAKLPAGTVTTLLRPENREKLRAILLYHVVAGRIAAADVKAGDVKTASGKSATLAVDAAGVHVNDATVTQADVAASNGVIHVVDRVLLPK